VIAGEEAGSKLEKAAELGVPIIGEAGISSNGSVGKPENAEARSFNSRTTEPVLKAQHNPVSCDASLCLCRNP
jgi:hypothetical protein